MDPSLVKGPAGSKIAVLTTNTSVLQPVSTMQGDSYNS